MGDLILANIYLEKERLDVKIFKLYFFYYFRTFFNIFVGFFMAYFIPSVAI